MTPDARGENGWTAMQVEKCRNCGTEIYLNPVLGWMHRWSNTCLCRQMYAAPPEAKVTYDITT